MTPHEHYKAAEHLLREIDADIHMGLEFETLMLRRAQVHATLASVATWPGDER